MEWIVGGLLIAAAVVGGGVALFRRESDAIGWAVVQLVLVAAAGILVLVAPTAGWSSIPLAGCAVLAATFGGGIVVKAVLRLSGHPMTADDDLPASAWIGLAERFAMTFALVIGQGAIAAVIIAVKALGSYRGDAQGSNRMASIRVLGTLSSVTWALLCYAVLVVAQTRMRS